MITIIIIGILFGVYLALDLLFTEKDKGYFKRNFIAIFATVIPLLIGVFFKDTSSNDNYITYHDWVAYFYPSFIITLFLFIGFSYFFFFNSMTKNIENYEHSKVKQYNFLDFIFMGYFKFRQDIENLKESSIKHEESLNQIVEVHRSLKNDLPIFIKEIYESSCENVEIDEYIMFVMESFVSNFLSGTDARFTFRELNIEDNTMDAILTTKLDDNPSPIPLDKDNLISLSAKKGEPVIFSRNPKYHYDTGKTIAKKIFDDYVTYTLLVTNDNKPYFSVNLDVKGTNAVNRMRALVDSSIFTIICNAIVSKIENELENISNMGDDINE